MSESRTTSTLELVVNEQQLRNMSQIDLSNGQTSTSNQQENTTSNSESDGFFVRFCSWPNRIRLTLNSKLDQIREKSDSNTDFALKLAQEFATIFAWSFCFLSTVVAPVIFILVGLFNFGQCSASPALPYVVFSTGFVMTTSNLFNLALACDLPILRNQEFLSDDLKNIIASIINVLLNVIAAFLFIICAHLVFTIDSTSTSSQANDEGSSGDSSALSPKQGDCNAFLYDFIYWYMTLTIIIILCLSLLALCLFAYNRYKLALVHGTTVGSSNNLPTNANINVNTNINTTCIN